MGGTTLDAVNPAGTYLGEMAWNDNTSASGGGYSSLFARPSYQDGLARAGATRGVPDVVANNDPASAMALVFGDGTLGPASDANAATPLWAGVIALADQQSGRPLGFINPAIYQIARGPAYDQAFHDVVTGWGSPDALYLVPLLAHAARSGGVRYARPGALPKQGSGRWRDPTGSRKLRACVRGHPRAGWRGSKYSPGCGCRILGGRSWTW